MANGRWIIELIDRAWVDLDVDEQETFDEWLKTARGHDLYILLRHVKRAKARQSSVKMAAVRGEDSEGD